MKIRVLYLMAICLCGSMSMFGLTDNSKVIEHLETVSVDDNSLKNSVVTAADIFGSKEKPTEEWSGFVPDHYRDMTFYDNDGMAHLRGRLIDYTQDCGVSTLSIRNYDDLTSSEKNYVSNINPDGTFEMDIPLHYPQINRLDLGETAIDLFLIPGDTLSFVSSMRRSNTPFMGYCPVYYGFEGKIDDCVAINVLADSISKHFDSETLWTRYANAQGDSMKVKTYANNERLACILDSVVAGLPAFLADVPVSAFAKDILSVLVIGDICEVMESLEEAYRNFNLQSLSPTSSRVHCHQ